jgi:uncharacterized membrane protein YbhN (UPF0104 family)
MSPGSLAKFVARLAVSVGLVWWVLQQIDGQLLVAQLERFPISALALPVIVIVLLGLLQAVRWSLVQEAMAAPLPFATASPIVYLSLFFNQTVPSTIGGDAVRVAYGCRAGLALATAVKEVLIDRVSALAALVVLGAASLPLLAASTDDGRLTVAVAALVTIGLGGVVALAAFKAMPAAIRRWPGARQLTGLSHAFWEVCRHPRKAVGITAISVTIHVALGICVAYVAWILGSDINPLVCVSLFPMIMLVSMIPVTIAGWGIREGAMVAGYTVVGMSHVDALATSVLFGGMLVVVGLIGAAIWLAMTRFVRTTAPGRVNL